MIRLSSSQLLHNDYKGCSTNWMLLNTRMNANIQLD